MVAFILLAGRGEREMWRCGDKYLQCLAGDITTYNQVHPAPCQLCSAICNLISLSGMFSHRPARTLQDHICINRIKTSPTTPAIWYSAIEIRVPRTLSEYQGHLTANSPPSKIYYAGFRFFTTLQGRCNHCTATTKTPQKCAKLSERTFPAANITAINTNWQFKLLHTS